jgi:Putative DNA-binding domain
MSELARLQTRMAQALLDGRDGALGAEVRAGPVAAAEALALHRNTALHGLVNALRLTYPTVDALVGEAFFDQAALAFVEDHPPASPWLTGYGLRFADFLASYDFAADIPYLPDVARLDAAIEAVAGQSLGEDGLQLDLGPVLLTLDASLRVIALDYPAAAIRDAIEDDDDALATIDMTPRRHGLALWRTPAGAALRPLGPTSTAFLKALLHGGDLEAALTDGGDAAMLQSEVFAAPFARLAIVERPQP